MHLYARSAAAYASLQAQIDAMTGAGIKARCGRHEKVLGDPWKLPLAQMKARPCAGSSAAVTAMPLWVTLL